MKKYIPYEKLSKKEKKKRDAAKRSLWEISPVTRRPENPKAYKRSRKKDFMNDENPFSCFCSTSVIWQKEERFEKPDRKGSRSRNKRVSFYGGISSWRAVLRMLRRKNRGEEGQIPVYAMLRFGLCVYLYRKKERRSETVSGEIQDREMKAS